eukprot:scaffold1220_cov259-Pinguiococcus_pyrenoidosus.AAC.91
MMQVQRTRWSDLRHDSLPRSLRGTGHEHQRTWQEIVNNSDGADRPQPTGHTRRGELIALLDVGCRGQHSYRGCPSVLAACRDARTKPDASPESAVHRNATPLPGLDVEELRAARDLSIRNGNGLELQRNLAHVDHSARRAYPCDCPATLGVLYFPDQGNHLTAAVRAVAAGPSSLTHQIGVPLNSMCGNSASLGKTAKVRSVRPPFRIEVHPLNTAQAAPDGRRVSPGASRGLRSELHHREGSPGRYGVCQRFRITLYRWFSKASTSKRVVDSSAAAVARSTCPGPPDAPTEAPSFSKPSAV